MKKVFLKSLYGIIFSLALAGNAIAQKHTDVSYAAKPRFVSAAEDKISADKNIANTDRENFINAKASLKASKADFKALKANLKAAAHFRKEFKDGPDVHWYVDEEAIGAYFNRNDIQTRVFYTKKGNWLHTISYYDRSKMPHDIRSLVISNYPDYNITGVQEIKEDNITFYIVHLEDETGYKEVSVYNGELNLYKEYNKAF